MDRIVWRFIVYPGHEFCHLYQHGGAWNLKGVAVFSHETQPCVLNYHVTCNSDWHTQSVNVEGWLGQKDVNIQIRVDDDQRWWMNEIAAPEVKGCLDIDLNFSPSTNTLPIRRLKLEVGARAEVEAAWLRFPSFTLEPLTQRYTRLEARVYRYESGDDRFMADLRVNSAGLVTDYPGIWTADSASL